MPQSRHPLLVIESWFDRFSNAIGYLSSFLLLLLVINVAYDVIMRYAFNDVSIAMQEMEWHLFSSIFLLGASYTLSQDGHVRVDLIYERLSPPSQGVIDIVGTILFIWPFCYLVASFGINFAVEAYNINEMSGDPGGLPDRWIIKSMVSVSFVLVFISSIGFLLHALNKALGLEKVDNNQEVIL